MIFLSLLAACDLLVSKSDDTGTPDADSNPPPHDGGTKTSQMPSASEDSLKDWNCDFLTDIANTGLEEYGLVAVELESTVYMYSEAGIPLWDKAADAWLNGINLVHGEVLYDGFFYQMTDSVVPGYVVASVTDGLVDFNLCRGYLWVETP